MNNILKHYQSGEVFAITQECYDANRYYIDNNFILIYLESPFEHRWHWHDPWEKDIIAYYYVMKI